MRNFLIISLFISSPSMAYENIQRGLYFLGADVDSFKECNFDKAYGVRHDWGLVHENLSKYYQSNNIDRQQPVYIKFDGELYGKIESEIKVPDHGFVYIAEIIELKKTIPNDC